MRVFTGARPSRCTQLWQGNGPSLTFCHSIQKKDTEFCSKNADTQLCPFNNEIQSSVFHWPRRLQSLNTQIVSLFSCVPLQHTGHLSWVPLGKEQFSWVVEYPQQTLSSEHSPPGESYDASVGPCSLHHPLPPIVLSSRPLCTAPIDVRVRARCLLDYP